MVVSVPRSTSRLTMARLLRRATTAGNAGSRWRARTRSTSSASKAPAHPRGRPPLPIGGPIVNRARPEELLRWAGAGCHRRVGNALCCAAPALVAGGLPASLGAAIRSPVVIALGIGVVGGGVVTSVGRRWRNNAHRPAQDGRAPASLGDETKPATRLRR